MNKAAIKQAAKKLAIKMVYLGGTETKFYNGFDPLVPGQELIGLFRISTDGKEIKDVVEGAGSQKSIKFRVSAGMRYIKGPLPSDLDEAKISEIVAAEISALFIAEYAIVGDGDLSPESLEEFGRVNAPFNVWPYWREYCQSTCSRMALPVTVIPMLTID